MQRSPEALRRDALAIWTAGVKAVHAERLIKQAVRRDGSNLVFGDQSIALPAVRRIVVVGGGKAGAGMAAGLEKALGSELMAATQLTGLINVPDNCVRPIERIRLHAARPLGVNEPTEAVIAGTEEMLRLVGTCAPDDLVIYLLSGGGSALLAAPPADVGLAGKVAITRFLSAAGANIQQLNTVRKHLSRVKGGGLARACRAGLLVTLVISDVFGDPLDVIGSGPTVDDTTTAADALAVLEKFGATPADVGQAVFDHLRNATPQPGPNPAMRRVNLVIGNNATAVHAAADEAHRLGYTPAVELAKALEPAAEEIGTELAHRALDMRSSTGPNCLITGGEPVVQLAPVEHRGKGGRNQQLVLAAAAELLSDRANGIVLLSGGTDGEDGPTDAAGAVVDETLLNEMARRGLDPRNHLRRNDAYPLFEELGGLIKTGPTHTNVCDVRVVLVSRTEDH